jgi:hypothetical protein
MSTQTHPHQVVPEHPSASPALILAIVSVAGAPFTVGLSLLVAPVAWLSARRAVRAIDSSAGSYAGRERAEAARLLGLGGTVLLGLWVVAVVAVVSFLLPVTQVTIQHNDRGPTITEHSIRH